jgi:hypothetical protein
MRLPELIGSKTLPTYTRIIRTALEQGHCFDLTYRYAAVLAEYKTKTAKEEAARKNYERTFIEWATYPKWLLSVAFEEAVEAQPDELVTQSLGQKLALSEPSVFGDGRRWQRFIGGAVEVWEVRRNSHVYIGAGVLNDRVQIASILGRLLCRAELLFRNGVPTISMFFFAECLRDWYSISDPNSYPAEPHLAPGREVS